MDVNMEKIFFQLQPSTITHSINSLLQTMTSSSIQHYDFQPGYRLQKQWIPGKGKHQWKNDLRVFDDTILKQHQMKWLIGSGLYTCFRESQEHTMLYISQIDFGFYPMDLRLKNSLIISITNIPPDKTNTLLMTKF